MLFTFWSTERCFSSSWLACRVNDFRPLCNTSLGTVRPGSSKRLISASTSTRVIQKANNSFILPFVFGAYQKKYNEFGTVAASSEGAFWGAKISSTAGVNFCFFVGCFSSPALAGSVFDSSSLFPSSTCVVFSCIRFLPRLHSSFSSSASFKAALTRDWACRKCNMIFDYEQMKSEHMGPPSECLQQCPRFRFALLQQQSWHVRTQLLSSLGALLLVVVCPAGKCGSIDTLANFAIISDRSWKTPFTNFLPLWSPSWSLSMASSVGSGLDWASSCRSWIRLELESLYNYLTRTITNNLV